MKNMIGVIIIVIVLIVIFIIFQKRVAKSTTASSPSNEIKPSQFETVPDLPVGFGYKCQWIAVKTVDTEAVLAEMQLKNVQVANWNTGIKGAYEGYYFISPPILGWTLVINSIMPDLTDTKSPSPLTAISDLSQKFGEAYYFGTHRVVEYHAWAKAVNGQVVRAYGYLGEGGETLIDEGKISQEEMENDLVFTGFDVDEPKLPREGDVLFIAKKWTVDPLMQQGNYQIGTGYVGTIE